MGYFPTSMDSRCQTYVCEKLLLLLRASILHQYPTGWSSRAETIDAAGAQLYNQVSNIHSWACCSAYQSVWYFTGCMLLPGYLIV